MTLCEEGRLYEYLMGRREILVRDWIKEEFFQMIYGKNSFRSPLKDDFRELFSGVAQVMQVHKRRDYRFLPRLMQNIEANFVINGLCRRLMRELPEAPVFTIHDSLLTTGQYVQAFQEVILEEFARLGLQPTLHVKDYGVTGESS